MCMVKKTGAPTDRDAAGNTCQPRTGPCPGFGIAKLIERGQQRRNGVIDAIGCIQQLARIRPGDRHVLCAFDFQCSCIRFGLTLASVGKSAFKDFPLDLQLHDTRICTSNARPGIRCAG